MSDHDVRGGDGCETGVVRKQYHLRPGELGFDAWDVDRLITMCEGLPVEEVALAEIDEIDSTYWFQDDDLPTVRRIVEHFRLVREVDLSYPIILGPDGRVMDGMHRVARALLEGHVTIKAVRLSTVPTPDFLSCRPEDLPY